MNNSKIWLVVNPTVGVPLFLSAVAVGSFAVHVAVLQNTTWVDDFLSGKELGASMAALPLEEGETMKAASFTSGTDGGEAILVTLPDGTVAHAVLTPEQSALLNTR
jgi:light-harvesting protein B-800-850 alpha chain